MAEKIFPAGLIVKKPNEGAPEFVKLKLSFKVDNFVAFATKNQDDKGWLNVDILKSKEGKIYSALNQFKKSAKVEDSQDLDY